MKFLDSVHVTVEALFFTYGNLNGIDGYNGIDGILRKYEWQQNLFFEVQILTLHFFFNGGMLMKEVILHEQLILEVQNSTLHF